MYYVRIQGVDNGRSFYVKFETAQAQKEYLAGTGFEEKGKLWVCVCQPPDFIGIFLNDEEVPAQSLLIAEEFELISPDSLCIHAR